MVRKKMVRKKNCWEYMQCGREPGGENALELGICPAAVDASHEGINSGSHAGRFCWAVAGTMCDGSVQGTFAEKRKSCTQCHFYNEVRAQEGSLNIRTKFLRFVQPYSQSSILKNLTLRQIHQGKRFIRQGEITQTAYIIQQGSCMELVEKKGVLYPVGHRGEGDIVGMISLVTGEPMGFHVEAETQMNVWVIKKKDFNRIPKQDPDLFAFLTELVADRFDRKGPIAERTIGKYLVTDFLGRGGYSIVYKGIHSELERPVAIKMMRHHLSMQKDFMLNFHNEAKLIARLNHANIVTIFDVEVRYKTLFIIYEYLDGESLEDMIKRLKTIPPDRALHFLRQLASAMAFAGQKGLIHRDINPSNIIVLAQDQIKLIDFGLACPLGTDDFLMGGNFNYLAPEQIDGEPADFRSDIYSLGITAFHMVTGQLPFSSDNQAILMKMMREATIPDPGKITKNLPEKLRLFILKACEKNPKYRFQTPDQARDFFGLPSPGPESIYSGLKKENIRTIKFEFDSDKENDFLILQKNIDNLVKKTDGISIINSGDKIITTEKNVLWRQKQDVLQTKKIEVAAQTDIGLERKTNQDRYAMRCFSDDTILMAIADGLGGEPGGEMASDYVMEEFKQLTDMGCTKAAKNPSFFFEKMDQALCALAEKNHGLNGMATTLISIFIKNHVASWCHSGDSRLYLLRKNRIRQITQDQTLARFLIQEGELTKCQAKQHYSKDVIDQCVGCQDVTPESGKIQLKPDDMLILASDGLYRSITEEEICRIISQFPKPEKAADALIKLSLDAGGKDNITVVIGKIH